MDNVTEFSLVSKGTANEIKSMNNPAQNVATVVICVANFVENRSDHTWKTANRKIYEFTRKGVGCRDIVSEGQLATLRAFAATGITTEIIKKASHAAAHLVDYLHAVHTLQEHLLQVKDLEIGDAGGIPRIENVDSVMNIGTNGNVQVTGGDELFYIKGKKGKKGKRTNSAGYLAANIEGAVNDEMERKADKDEDSDYEELGLDGKPKHRFYNEELEQKTKAIQDQFNELYSQL